MSKKVTCPHCNSSQFIKKGISPSGTSQKFLCKACGKNFSIKIEDLIGTPYEVKITSNTNSTSTTPKTNSPKSKPQSPKTSSSTKIADKTSKDNTNTDSSDYIMIDDIDLGKVKKDSNGNFLMKIGNKTPIPIGSSKEDLVAIVRKHGGSCTLKLNVDGIFVLNVNTTTKGYI